jgi:TetR/AcrR family transcriptional regulator, cholesterol catabolism regulator
VTPGRVRGDGTKRREILAAATERFGRDGYEDTKWADIAADVGVGSTALYHYFESKQHCLYLIIDQAIEDFRMRLVGATAAHSDDPSAALVAAIQACFDLSEREVLRNRLLTAEQGLLSTRRTSPREEEARQAARARGRDLELAWATLLSDAMRRGAIPADDERMLARAVLGTYNSIWQWYRPHGAVALHRVAEFFIDRILAMIGIAPGTAGDAGEQDDQLPARAAGGTTSSATRK